MANDIARVIFRAPGEKPVVTQWHACCAASTMWPPPTSNPVTGVKALSISSDDKTIGTHD
jgi:hypothetical protein